MEKTDHFHGEIFYEKVGIGNVHSDLCSHKITEEYRELLHSALDEFLNNYNPNGGFYVGNCILGED